MTISLPDPNEDMRALALRFLGAFSHLQDCIDQMVARIFFEKRMPGASEVVWKRTVSRIKDEERVELFMAIAEEIRTDAELGSFDSIYNRVKRLRDSVAHSARFLVRGNDQLAINRTVVKSPRTPELPVTEVDRTEILDALRDCTWLEAQILYVLSSDDLGGEVRLGPAPLEVLKPADLPEKWDGTVFRTGPRN